MQVPDTRQGKWAGLVQATHPGPGAEQEAQQPCGSAYLGSYRCLPQLEV